MISEPANATLRKNIHVSDSAAKAAVAIARKISNAIKQHQLIGKTFRLGLATGATPVPLYKELIKLYQQGDVNFKNVHTYNLDEYDEISFDNPNSYHGFMRENLFDHINIPLEQTHFPSGDDPAAYDREIASVGGLDLLILGIGSNGHIAFNEPGSEKDSPSRLIELDASTIADNKQYFPDGDMPTRAITMGLKTILDTKTLVLMAWGDSKASIIAESLSCTPSADLPASFLQDHPNTLYFLDHGSASKLS
ncbi:glucosamine-6-phosphate deaminase [Persicirhabdus sediminis]|nr:glucosamine-6-phosphate deaminase [Persicirhabdus sediminis]